MRRGIIICLLGALVITVLAGCWASNEQAETQPAPMMLEDAMKDYESAVAGELPEDFRLTITFMNPIMDTRAPVRVEDLKNYPCRTIVVDAQKLDAYAEMLRKLDASMLKPVAEPSYVNARLYCIFEVGEAERVLDFVTNADIGCSFFVNGVEVAYNPVFYELILPFLTEEDIKTLDIERHLAVEYPPEEYSKESLKQQAADAMRRAVDSFSGNEDAYEEIAREFLFSEKTLYYYFETGEGNLSKSLTWDVIKLRDECATDLDAVYIGRTWPGYPEKSCVFSRVIRNGYETYCWIDLVYCEDWDAFLDANKQMVEEGLIQQIASNWCVVQYVQ